MTSKVLLERLNGMGEYVKSASSTIEPPVVRRYREKFPEAAPKAAAPAKKAAGAAPAKAAAAPAAAEYRTIGAGIPGTGGGPCGGSLAGPGDHRTGSRSGPGVSPCRACGAGGISAASAHHAGSRRDGSCRAGPLRARPGSAGGARRP